MPFTPSLIDYYRTDVTGRLARFFDEDEGPKDWIVREATIGKSSVDAARWTFSSVERDLRDPGWMNGTLVFKPPAGFPRIGNTQDQTLHNAWNSGNATLELNVWCKDYSRPLSVRLRK